MADVIDGERMVDGLADGVPLCIMLLFPFVGTPRYFNGNDAAVVILDPTDKGGGN